MRADGAPVDFLGAEHVLQFDVTHDTPAPSAPIVEAPFMLQELQEPDELDGPPGVFADMGADLAELLRQGAFQDGGRAPLA